MTRKEVDWDAPPSVYENRTSAVIAATTIHGPDTRHPYALGIDTGYPKIRPDQTDPNRWEVTRTGERSEILWPLRRAIALRDNFTCRRCHRWIDTDHERFELDHIVPWSAGGTDESHNLRLTCVPCNQRRGNSIDGDERHSMPVTWWCVQCWSQPEQLGRRDFWHGAGWAIEWANIPHQVEDGFVVAFCAFCRHVSTTDVTL